MTTAQDLYGGRPRQLGREKALQSFSTTVIDYANELEW